MRVLIGSTQKMGTGTNVQKRLVALHHLDAPWKPAEVEQRDGRILRQGNENKEVAIYRYVTEGSFDAYMWQALETKARFIGQVITGDNAARRAEDIGGQELSYAEVKAIASGNPAVLTLAKTDAELQRLGVLKRNHADEQYLARRSVRDLPGTIASLSERLSNLTADQATTTAHADDPIIISNRRLAREDVGAALAAQLDTLPTNIREKTRVPLGTYRGLRFGMVLNPQWSPEVYLEGATTRLDTLSRDHHGPRAVLNALERLVGAYGSECVRVQQDLSIAESQMRDYQARLGKPFLHDAYLSELTSLRDQLKAGLSGTAHQPDTEEGPSVSELAERIKSLKAAHSIEATPQRARQKHSSAEEPVTARIRRRAETPLVSDPAIEADAAASQTGTPANHAGTTQASSTKPPNVLPGMGCEESATGRWVSPDAIAEQKAGVPTNPQSQITAGCASSDARCSDTRTPTIYIQLASLFATALASSLSPVTTRMSDNYFPRQRQLPHRCGPRREQILHDLPDGLPSACDQVRKRVPGFLPIPCFRILP